MTLDDIKNEIENANSIVIETHETPDGDAVGSCLAMYLALKSIGKDVDVVIPIYSRTFNFLPGASEIKTEGRNTRYDLGIAMDCTDTKRLKGYEPYFENARTTINIDHHGSNKMFADYNYVDPVAPACAQILIVVLKKMGIEINKEIGTCILSGIITDTGGFKYEGVTTETFEFVAELLRKGVNVSDTYKRVLQIKTKANFLLTKKVMERLEFLEEGKITFTYITKQDEKEVNAEEGDHEGLVEFGRDVEGVEVSIFLRELESGAYKVSLRSKNYVNVSDVCIKFNGGGHEHAAGCTIDLPLEEAKEKIINHVKTYLKVEK